MRKIYRGLFFIITLSLYANDGGIRIEGGSLYPVTITNVSIDYERLTIVCKERTF